MYHRFMFVWADLSPC